MLSTPYLLLYLRCLPPAVCLMGTTATYMSSWALLQCAALVLPKRTADKLETALYSSYQAMVGFWFETWSGAEVCLLSEYSSAYVCMCL